MKNIRRSPVRNAWHSSSKPNYFLSWNSLENFLSSCMKKWRVFFQIAYIALWKLWFWLIPSTAGQAGWRACNPLLLSLFHNYFLYFPNACHSLNVLHMPTIFPLIPLFLVISFHSLLHSLFIFSFYISILVHSPNLSIFSSFPQHMAVVGSRGGRDGPCSRWAPAVGWGSPGGTCEVRWGWGWV